MSDAVIVAVITGIFSLLGQMFIVKNQNKKTCSSVDERLSWSDKLTAEQILGIRKEIDLLSARMDRRNGFGE